MIKYKKLIAVAFALCFVGGGLPEKTAKFSDNSISAFALDSEKGVYGNYEYFTYVKYSDHVEVVDGDNTATNIVIPEKISELPVTIICKDAFAGCTELTSVAIPKSIKKIGNYAFSGCVSLKSIIIPESIISIEEGTFYNCSNLISIFLSDNILDIGTNAFSGCTSLTNITMPDALTGIDDNAFYNCESLESITIPDGVVGIGRETFSGCKNLTSVEIPEGVININAYTFSGCTGLKNVVLPESLMKINEGLFSGCTNLTSITIPSKIKNIGKSAFEKCKSLESVTLPDKIKSIGDSAFFDCSKLTSINIPDTLESIGNNAFFKCSALTSMELPESVKSIGNWAFRSCKGLNSITINNSECEIYDSENTIPETTVIYGYAGSTAQAYAEKYNLKFETIGIEINFTYEKCKDHIEITGCSKDITEVVIPAEIEGLPVTIIGDSAFEKCKLLESVKLPDSITSIGDAAFFDCSKITSINIPENITSIGSKAFFKCSAFTSIELPESVTSIGNWAFRSCSGLNSITINNPECEIYDSENTIPKTTVIYGYAGSTAQAYAEKYGNDFVILGEEITYGDANGDGKITIADVVALQEWLLGTGELTDWKAVDLCKDNRIDSFDYCLLRKMIVDKK